MFFKRVRLCLHIFVYFSDDTKRDREAGGVYVLVLCQVNRTCLSPLEYPVPHERVTQTCLTRYDTQHDPNHPSVNRSGTKAQHRWGGIIKQEWHV